MKKDERKSQYTRIMGLMLKGEDKQAFEALVCLCGEDTGLFWLGNYEETKAAIAANLAKVGGAA